MSIEKGSTVKGKPVGIPSRWKPGQSGNPNGRPAKTREELDLIAACKERTPKALAVIDALMLDADKDSVRLAAATYIVDRAFGKPLQRLEGDQDPLATALTSVLLDMRDLAQQRLQETTTITIPPQSLGHVHPYTQHPQAEVPQ